MLRISNEERNRAIGMLQDGISRRRVATFFLMLTIELLIGCLTDFRRQEVLLIDEDQVSKGLLRHRKTTDCSSNGS